MVYDPFAAKMEQLRQRIKKKKKHQSLYLNSPDEVIHELEADGIVVDDKLAQVIWEMDEDKPSNSDSYDEKVLWIIRKLKNKLCREKDFESPPYDNEDQERCAYILHVGLILGQTTKNMARAIEDKPSLQNITHRMIRVMSIIADWTVKQDVDMLRRIYD